MITLLEAIAGYELYDHGPDSGSLEALHGDSQYGVLNFNAPNFIERVGLKEVNRL